MESSRLIAEGRAMASIALTSTRKSVSTLVADLVTWSRFSAPLSDWASLSEQLLIAYSGRVSKGILKQADEQSILALLALQQALNAGRIDRTLIPSWGLVSSPQIPGRQRLVDTFKQFREKGAWSVSPHIIPNVSLHSQSGLISQALDLHGPNIGAGGMPGTESEAIFAALAWLEGERLPGVWVVFTRSEPMGEAIVLGLCSSTNSLEKAQLTLTMNPAESLPPLSIDSLGCAIDSHTSTEWNLMESASLLLTWPEGENR